MTPSLEVEVLLAYGASRRGCALLRRNGVTTLGQLGEYVRCYREAARSYPRHLAHLRFQSYLGCAGLGPNTADRLLAAYERWERSYIEQRRVQNEPSMVMV